MARDQALLKNALLDLKRYQSLSEQDSIPKQQLDTQEALVRQYEGAVKVDQGQIDNAKLQLVYSRITAPSSSRRAARTASIVVSNSSSVSVRSRRRRRGGFPPPPPAGDGSGAP